MTRKFTFTILAMLFAILGPGAKAWGQSYVKITSTSDLTDGTYLIVNEASSRAFNGLDAANGYVSVVISDGKIADANGAAIVEIKAMTGGYSLKITNGDNAGKYIYGKSGSNSIQFGATAVANEITFSDGAATILSNSTSFRYNKQSGNDRFRYYKTATTGSNYIVPALYKKQSAPTHTLTLSATNGSISAVNGSTQITSGDNVAEGAELDITATANDWYKFSGWNVSGTGSTLGSTTANPTTFTMGTADATLTATFAACVVTVSSNDENWGIALYDNESHTISTAAEDGYRISSTKPYTINPADAATLTPGEDGEYTVSGVKDQDVEITINFEALPSDPYTVTFNAGTNGTCSTTELTESSAGAGVTLPDCTPNAGYQFVGWATTETATEANAGVAGETYNPTENITLYAVYNQVYTIIWSVNGAPTTDGNPTTSVVAGEGITTLPTTPADISGMKFQGWTATQIATSSATAPTDLFTDAEHAPAITANTTFYAVFAEESEGDVTWVKKSVSEISEGGVYAIITTDGHAFNGNINSSGHGQVTTTAFSFTNNVAASAPSGTCEITFEAVTGGFKMYNADNGYLYASAASSGNLAWHNTEDSYWYYNSSDNGNWMYKSNNARLRSYNNASIRTYNANTGNVLAFAKKTQDITYTYYTNVVVKVLTSISLSGEYPTEFWKGETFNHDGMTVTAHYENADDENVTDKATFTGYDMATAGEQTVTVTYETASTTYSITVKNIANTQETAYTTAEAIDLIDANPAELVTTEVYVKGTVSKIVTEWSSQYGNITFDVSADGQTTGDQFRFYRNFKGANKTPWASAAECPAVGDDVIGLGKLTKYDGSTYEFTEGNYIVSLIRFATLSIDDITVSLGGTITPEITSNVPEDERTITYSVASEDEDVVKVQDGKLVTVAVGGPVEVTATLTAKGYKSAETTFTVEVIKALQSIAVKTAPTTSYKAGDFFNPEGLVITATYSDASTGDIAYEGNEDSFAFEPSLETALTTENTSVTITYAGKETTQEIVVRALYTYDITWMANGIAVTLEPATVVEGNTIGTLPTLTNDNIPNGFDFAGWSLSESSTTTIGETYIVNENVNLYAVFSRVEGGTQGSGNYEKVTSALTDWRGDYLIAYSSEIFADGKTGGTDGLGKQYQKANPESNLSEDGNTVSAQWGDTYHVTLENIEGSNTYLLKTQDGKYNYQSSNANGLASTTNRETAAQYPITVNFVSEDEINLALGGNAVGAVFRYNTAEFFRYYRDGGQSPVYLYKKDEGTPGVTKYYTRVQSISGNTEITTVTTADLITVPNGAVLTITGSCTGDPENLIIEDGGQLIVNNKGVQATMKKHIENTPSKDGPARSWYTISSPLAASVNVTDVSYLIPDNNIAAKTYDLYYLNEKDGVWVNARPETGQSSSFTKIDKGVGYIYSNAATTDIAFEGEVNVADVDVKLSLTADKGKGYNLIGNPFTQNIKLTDVKSGGTAELAGGFYVLTNQDTWGTEPSFGTIAPLQGFLVQAKTAGDVTISKNVSSKGERSNEQNTNIEMIVSNASFKDNAYAMFGEGIGLNKVSHRNAEAPMLYVPQDGEDFAIAFMDENTTVFPVSFKAMTTGSYSISLKATDDISTLVLVDNMTGEETNMLLEDSYTFIGSPADNENRFTVKLTISHNDGQSDSEHFVYQNGSELVINGEGTLQIFDVLGRVVISEEVHGQTVNVGGLNTGAYIARLTGESVKTQKIVVR